MPNKTLLSASVLPWAHKLAQVVLKLSHVSWIFGSNHPVFHTSSWWPAIPKQKAELEECTIHFSLVMRMFLRVCMLAPVSTGFFEDRHCFTNSTLA